MTSITPDELQERLSEVLRRVREGETFAIVAGEEVIAGLLPVARLRLQADRHESVAEPPATRSPDASPSGPRRASSDEATLERLREEHERTHD